MTYALYSFVNSIQAYYNRLTLVFLKIGYFISCEISHIEARDKS